MGNPTKRQRGQRNPKKERGNRKGGCSGGGKIPRRTRDVKEKKGIRAVGPWGYEEGWKGESGGTSH